jgi:hypothetical protein
MLNFVNLIAFKGKVSTNTNPIWRRRLDSWCLAKCLICCDLSHFRMVCRSNSAFSALVVLRSVAGYPALTFFRDPWQKYQLSLISHQGWSCQMDFSASLFALCSRFCSGKALRRSWKVLFRCSRISPVPWSGRCKSFLGVALCLAPCLQVYWVSTQTAASRPLLRAVILNC